jgi:hypothetical protein
MESISIISVPREEGDQFCAVSGTHQSFGRTMGEALDALTREIGSIGSAALILIQKREPDQFFTLEQHERMQELLARREALSHEERAELESLVDAELDATVARTNALVHDLAA